MAEGEVALPKVGDIVAGKYRVVRRLAKGGMGVIFECEHTFLSQKVALKVLTDVLQPDSKGRFLNEARAAASLESDHAVRVFDFGTLDDGTPYIAMELLSGRDLAATIKARGKLEVGEAVDAVMEALEALAQAHARGIIHRDLKPANLFVATRPGVEAIVKVLDFGISKASHTLASAAPVHTSSNALLGSPLYMSPEQLRNSRGIDARTDIWSIGVILYESLTGKPPFNGQHLGELFAAVLERDPPPVRSLRPDLPKALEAAITTCLQREPEARFASAGALAQSLAPFAGPRGAAALQKIRAHGAEAPIDETSAPGFAHADTTAAQLTAGGGWQRESRAGRRGVRTLLGALGIALALAFLVVTGVIAVRYDPDASRRVPATDGADSVSLASSAPPPPPAVSASAAASVVAVVSAPPSASASAAPARTRTPRPAPTYDPFSGPRR
jgi:serine/threonine-protein kinase